MQVDHRIVAKPFRLPVQLVVRPDQEFRGYAGQILAGSIRVGDPITRVAVGADGARSRES